MTDFTSVPTVELLTRAADAARGAASAATGGPWQVVLADRVQSGEVESGRPFVADCDSSYELEPDPDADQANARLIAASGPDHWRAVEATLRQMLLRHAMENDRGPICICGIPWRNDGCGELDALRPLAEQVLHDLGETL